MRWTCLPADPATGYRRYIIDIHEGEVFATPMQPGDRDAISQQLRETAISDQLRGVMNLAHAIEVACQFVPPAERPRKPYSDPMNHLSDDEIPF